MSAQNYSPDGKVWLTNKSTLQQDIGHYLLWLLLTKKAFAKSKHYIMLNLCAPKHRAILKGKRENLEVFRRITSQF